MISWEAFFRCELSQSVLQLSEKSSTSEANGSEGLAPEELKRLSSQPIEHLTVEARKATIGIIVQSLPSGSLRVVIQGFMDARFIPGKHVAIDGFYKLPDGAVAQMPDKEFYEFD